MTALCGGGTSAPKVGVAAVVDYTAGLLALKLVAYGLDWLVPVIPLLDLAPLVLNSFCASDPPTMPVFTANQVNALLNLQILSPDFQTGLSNFSALLQNVLWVDACRCTSGTLTPPAAPAQPAGTPVTQYPPNPTSGTCKHVSIPQAWQFAGNLDCAATVLNQWSNAQNVHIRNDLITIPIHTGQSLTTTWTIPPNAAYSILIPSSSVCMPFLNAGGVDLTGLVNPSSVTLTITSYYDSVANVTNYGFTYDVYCSGAAGIIPLNCCPQDPASQLMLQTAMQMLTLLQRYVLPFAYIQGTVHAGITGSGSFSVQSLSGIQTHVSAYPASLRTAGGFPTYIYDLGWLSILTADGLIDEHRLTRVDSVWQPRLMEEAITFGYFLNPGVTVTFTELQVEA